MWSSQLTNEYSRWEIDGQQIIWTKSIIAQWTMTIISDGSGDARCAEQMFAWCKWDVFVVHIMQTNGTIHWSWSACTCLDQLKWIDYEFRFLNRTNRLTYHWHWHSNCDSGWDRSTVEPARGVSVSVAWRDFQWLYVLLFFSTPLDYFFQGYLPNWTERGRFSSQNQWRIWQGGEGKLTCIGDLLDAGDRCSMFTCCTFNWTVVRRGGCGDGVAIARTIARRISA